MQLGNYVVQVIGIGILLALGHNHLAQLLVQRHMRDIKVSKLSVGHMIDQVRERIHLGRIIGWFDKGAWRACWHCSLSTRSKRARRDEVHQQAGQGHDHCQRDQGQRDEETSSAPSGPGSAKRGVLLRFLCGLAPGWQDDWRSFCIFRHKASWRLSVFITIANPCIQWQQRANGEYLYYFR